MADLTRRDLIKILAVTREARLFGVDLSGEQLQALNFDCADMRRVNLTGADCSGASFNRTALFQASLRDANLTAADLYYADLSSADLRGACLRNATLRLVDLTGADLRGADFRGATVHLWPMQIGNARLDNILTDDDTEWIVDETLDDIPPAPALNDSAETA
jgi:uncharacterized protein YjbI with pentapeptide repeats